MTRRAAKKRPHIVRKSQKPRLSWNLSPTAWRRLAVGTLWGGALAVFLWCTGRLDAHVATITAAESPHVVWHELPVWLQRPGNQPVLDEIESRLALPESAAVDLQLPRLVGEQIAASPWVAGVRRVTQLPGGELHVDAQFREPLCYVEVRGQAYLIDRSGVRLPPQCSATTIPGGEWFLITGTEFTRTEIGQRWEGEDIAAGIKLVTFLRRAAAQNLLPFASWLRAVDVSNFNRRERELDGRLRIQTVHPACYIDWGEPPGEEHSVEVPAAEKLNRLNRLFSELGQIPERIVIVRWPDGIDFKPPSR